MGFLANTLMTLLLLSGCFLMFIVLLQRGRGGGLAGAFGGLGGQSAFGTKAGDVFTKITVVVAIVWVLLAAFAGLALRAASTLYNVPDEVPENPTITGDADPDSDDDVDPIPDPGDDDDVTPKGTTDPKGKGDDPDDEDSDDENADDDTAKGKGDAKPGDDELPLTPPPTDDGDDPKPTETNDPEPADSDPADPDDDTPPKQSTDGGTTDEGGDDE